MSEDFPPQLAGFQPGSLVAGYRLEEQIGAGGMAVVYRAHDERLGRLVALKILAPTLASTQEFRQRFIPESRAAAAVDHPHIIPVFEAGEADGALFIAMRFVEGGDYGGSWTGGPAATVPRRRVRLPGGLGAGRRACARPGPPGRQARNILLDAPRTARPRLPVRLRPEQRTCRRRG